MNDTLQKLIEKRGPIRNIGVIGMGYVGIPAAALFANSPKFSKVYGFQRNSRSSGYKIAMLNKGESPLKGDEPGLEELLKKVVSENKFQCTDDFSKIADCDAITIAIQTPFKDPKDLIPDFGALEEGIKQAGKYITPGALVVLESTITPGTTSGMAKSILEKESGMKAGEDFALAHAPERVMVGRLIKNIQEHDRIVGGFCDVSTKRAQELYQPVLTSGKIIPMSSTAAEATKTAENTFRDLQIAAANQLALYCESMGVNFYDVRAGVDSLKGDGITRAILWPGAGVGGHCLTKDTYHLERGIEYVNYEPLNFPKDVDSLFVTARHINDFMPMHMFHLLKKGFEKTGKPVKDSSIALLGWAFLANTDDARNTPAEPFYEKCRNAGINMKIHDPWVKDYPGIIISDDILSTIKDVDGIVIFTNHKEYYSLSPELVKKATSVKCPIIIDGRNVINPDSFIKSGFSYKGIGRGDKNNHPLVVRS